MQEFTAFLSSLTLEYGGGWKSCTALSWGGFIPLVTDLLDYNTLLIIFGIGASADDAPDKQKYLTSFLAILLGFYTCFTFN